MYQRAAKKQPASASSLDGMSTVTFFKLAKENLQRVGYEDEAFYFEQVETWLRDGKSLPTTDKEVSKVLGL